ncbi:MAG TPA: hypothetical protein VHV47_05375 [Opitutaceae bacterium]|nr:hypothetical protein [Opitutaceae bacterium]
MLAFAAGYGVRIWVDQTRPVPAPPPIGQEFTDATRSAPEIMGTVKWPAPNRGRLAAEIERLRPEIDAFRKSLHDIDTDFDQELQALLTPEQKEFYAARRKRLNPPNHHQTGTLTDQEIIYLRERPFESAVERISVEWKVEDLDKDLKFDAEQKAKVRDLLSDRRGKFIALVDNVPPPSLSLINLAPLAQRLAEPKEAAAAPAKP